MSTQQNTLDATITDLLVNDTKSSSCVMRFCPICANLLFVTDTPESYMYKCQTCSYNFHIAQPIISTHKMQRKEVDDVLGGADAWKNVDQIDVACVKCPNTRAYFMQLQTRSADEPMTIFYKCTNRQCNARWKQ